MCFILSSSVNIKPIKRHPCFNRAPEPSYPNGDLGACGDICRLEPSVDLNSIPVQEWANIAALGYLWTTNLKITASDGTEVLNSICGAHVPWVGYSDLELALLGNSVSDCNVHQQSCICSDCLICWSQRPWCKLTNLRGESGWSPFTIRGCQINVLYRFISISKVDGLISRKIIDVCTWGVDQLDWVP